MKRMRMASLLLILIFQSITPKSLPVLRSPLKMVVPDFQLNKDAGPFGAMQSSAVIAVSLQGDYVIAWLDARNTAYDALSCFNDTRPCDIYAQRYTKNGARRGSNFRVNSKPILLNPLAENDHDPYEYCKIDVAMDELGHFIVVWSNTNQDDHARTFFQLYDADGYPQGGNKILDIQEESATDSQPSVVLVESGLFAVLWHRDLGVMGKPDTRICLQCISADAQLVGNPVFVNDRYSGMINGETVSSNGDGAMVAAFVERQENDFKIFSQRSFPGKKIGVNLQLNDHRVFSHGEGADCGVVNPAVAVKQDGAFAVCWNDERLNTLFMQQCDSRGKPIRGNIALYKGAAHSNRDRLVLTCINDTALVLLWHENLGAKTILMGQYLSCSDTLQRRTLSFAAAHDSVNQLYPDLAVVAGERLLVTWSEQRCGDYNIVAQFFSVIGSPLSQPFRVNDDFSSSLQSHPTLAVLETGDFVTVWMDHRNGRADVYMKKCTRDGAWIGEEFQVDSEANFANCRPSIAVTPANPPGNRLLLAWLSTDVRLPNSVWAQFINDQGQPSSRPFLVSDTMTVDPFSLAMARDASGCFILTWIDRLTKNIYAQRLNAEGRLLDRNFTIIDAAAAAGTPTETAVTCDAQGDFLVVWTQVAEPSHADRSGTIMGRKVSSKGELIAAPFRVTGEREGVCCKDPAVAFAAADDFVVAWADNRNGHFDIYAQYYSHWQPVGSEFLATNDAARDQEHPCIQFKNGYFYTAWEDNRYLGTAYNIFANIQQYIGAEP